MAKRESVMLAHPFKEEKDSIGGWYVSDKIDGQRCFWDGGITRGMPISKVPFANTDRDGRYVDQEMTATGLWSRYYKAIQAPDWWIDRLPKLPLDGELYAGLGQFQFVTSVVSRLIPDDRWRQIRYHIFDSPSFESIFADGLIEWRIGNNISRKQLLGVDGWAETRAKDLGIFLNIPSRHFELLYKWLLAENIENEVIKLHVQTQLPIDNQKCQEMIKRLLDEVTNKGGEGLILRKTWNVWLPERSHDLLKVKRRLDAEAVVKGAVWGRATNHGSKLLGMMGALIVEWNGKIFELSGFNDVERQVTFKGSLNDARDIGRLYAGKAIDTSKFEVKAFPIDSAITFKYRELTDAGIPKEASYDRK